MVRESLDHPSNGTISEDNLQIPGVLQLATVDPPVVELELVKPSNASDSSKPFLNVLGIGSNDNTDEYAGRDDVPDDTDAGSDK